jgi:transposase-like protein
LREHTTPTQTEEITMNDTQMMTNMMINELTKNMDKDQLVEILDFITENVAKTRNCPFCGTEMPLVLNEDTDGKIYSCYECMSCDFTLENN